MLSLHCNQITAHMIHKQIVQNQLYVYMNGALIYKRWLNYGYGMVFCKLGNFTAKDVNINARLNP